MSQTISQPAAPNVTSGGPPLPGLPDINAQTYPYEFVQHLLDKTADFNAFAVPDAKASENATLLPGNEQDYFSINGGYGVDLYSKLHHFDASIGNATPENGVLVRESFGDSGASFHCRCFFGGGDFPWAVNSLPPPAIFDRWRAQRFAITECDIDFGRGASSKAYGVGRTYPISAAGIPMLLIAGVGNMMEGTGKLKDLEATFIFTGTLTPDLGFLGNITFRVVDPNGLIQTDGELSFPGYLADPDPMSTFVVLHGRKEDLATKTVYGPPPGGNQVTLITPSSMRPAQFSFSTGGVNGLRTSMSVGPIVCDMDANVFFDLLAPPGTPTAPVPFTTKELYKFKDRSGRVVGTISAGVVEGISFELKFPAAPGQKGVRFSGFGPITGGTGAFAGVQGMLTVNSLIGIAPHELALVHVLHLVDPFGKFRA